MSRRFTSAYEYIIYLLSRRDYSQKEIIDKLRQKEFDPQESQEALEKCISLKYQSDYRYTENFIRSKLQSFYGKYSIEQKLKLKGITQDIYDEVFEELDIDWFEIAKGYFILKRYYLKDLSDFNTKNKILKNFVNRGFSFDLANSILDQYKNGTLNIQEYI